MRWLVLLISFSVSAATAEHGVATDWDARAGALSVTKCVFSTTGTRTEVYEVSAETSTAKGVRCKLPIDNWPVGEYTISVAYKDETEQSESIFANFRVTRRYCKVRGRYEYCTGVYKK